MLLPSVGANRDGFVAKTSADTVIDYAAMERAIADWPESGRNDPRTMFRYQFNLYRALAGAHFARNACG